MLLHLTSTVTVNALYLPRGSPTGAEDPIESLSGEIFPGPRPQSRVVYSPHIIKPTSGTIWKTGSTVTVTWYAVSTALSSLLSSAHLFPCIRDTRDAPEEITNNKGRILLGHQSPNSDSEHLDAGKSAR